MLFLIPTDVETLERHRPWANYVLIGLTVVVFFLTIGATEASSLVDALILQRSHTAGIIGHVFLHANLGHLVGNMIFLWTFGNVICRTTSNALYPVLYFVCAFGAAATHLLTSRSPAVGASGAINGIVGIALAMFPMNRVDMRYLVMTTAGTFQIRLWLLASIWFILDLWGASRGSGNVAYSAHIGGLLTGMVLGLFLLATGKVQLSIYDHKSLYEMLTGRELERLTDEFEPDEET